MWANAHTIARLFFKFAVSKRSLAEGNHVQFSRKPVFTLVGTQHSTAHQAGTLLSGVARGDEATSRLFFEATNGVLFGLLLRILGHTQTTEEVMAEVYEEVTRRAARFNTQSERPLTWLILIAHRRAIERLCSQLTANREKFHKTTRSAAIPVSSINITEQRRLIRATLETISPLQHRMIELAFFSGMTSLEIAKELGLTQVAVEGGIRYAMLQLFGLFKSLGFTLEPGT